MPALCRAPRCRSICRRSRDCRIKPPCHPEGSEAESRDLALIAALGEPLRSLHSRCSVGMTEEICGLSVFPSSGTAMPRHLPPGGSDATAAGGRTREQSEWPRSARDDGACHRGHSPGNRNRRRLFARPYGWGLIGLGGRWSPVCLGFWVSDSLSY